MLVNGARCSSLGGGTKATACPRQRWRAQRNPENAKTRDTARASNFRDGNPHPENTDTLS